MPTIELEKPKPQAARRLTDLLSLEKAWASCLPDFRTPPEGQFYGWLRSSDFDTLLYAIEAGGKKANYMKKTGEPMAAANVQAYIAGILKNRQQRG